jgi:ribosomal protein L9
VEKNSGRITSVQQNRKKEIVFTMLFDPEQTFLGRVNEGAIRNDGLLQLINVVQNHQTLQEAQNHRADARRYHAEQMHALAVQAELTNTTNQILDQQLSVQLHHAMIAEQTHDLLLQKEERDMDVAKKTKDFRVVLNHAKDLLEKIKMQCPPPI